MAEWRDAALARVEVKETHTGSSPVLTTKIKVMKAVLVKHPRNYFGFRKDKMYHNSALKTTLSFALGKYRLLIS